MKKGFTLIELLVAIAIMVILTGIVIASISGTKSKSRDANKVASVNSVIVSLEAYYSKYRSYPFTMSDSNFIAFLGTDASKISALGITYIPLYSGSGTCSNTLAKPNFYHIGVTLENNVTVDKAGKNGSVLSSFVSGLTMKLCNGVTDTIDGTAVKVYDSIPSF